MRMHDGYRMVNSSRSHQQNAVVHCIAVSLARHPPSPCRCEYPVADRPYAIQQWLESGDVQGDWVFMIETDYVFVK